MWQYLLPIAGAYLGSRASSSGQKQEMDPRLAGYVYGGLLPQASNLFNRQMAAGGLNDLQRQGLEMQRSYLLNPSYAQGYSNLLNLGQGLLGGGVAGNPFSAGSSAGFQNVGGYRPSWQPFDPRSVVLDPRALAAPNVNATTNTTNTTGNTGNAVIDMGGGGDGSAGNGPGGMTADQAFGALAAGMALSGYGQFGLAPGAMVAGLLGDALTSAAQGQLSSLDAAMLGASLSNLGGFDVAGLGLGFGGDLGGYGGEGLGDGTGGVY